MASVTLAAQEIPEYFKEPQPPIPPAPVEFIGPNYCTPGLEADEYDIGMEDTTYRLIVTYNLEMEDIEKYNSNLKDINSITAGGTICLPPGTLESKL
ncbi:hypothetical protein HON71_04915 [Candidatus Woesearchaeota archaeon]|nr:hypothetical protein [Candidatus Woesearchaeota archaeon]MBT5342375.1 hypothetical protein [Candidatus Woesearchaeota archaeon]